MDDWEIECDTEEKGIGGDHWIVVDNMANDTHVPASIERFTRLVDGRISILEKKRAVGYTAIDAEVQKECGISFQERIDDQRKHWLVAYYI